MRVGLLVMVLAGLGSAQEALPLERIFAARPPWGFPPKEPRLSPDGERVLLLEVPPATEEPAAETPRPGSGDDRSASKPPAVPPIEPAAEPTYEVTLRDCRSGDRLRLPHRFTEPGRLAFAPGSHRVLYTRGKEVIALDADGTPKRMLAAEQAAFGELRTFADGSVLASAGDQHWLLARGDRQFQPAELPKGARVLDKAAAARRFLIDLTGNAGAGEVATLALVDGGRELTFTLKSRPVRVALAPDGSLAAFVTSTAPERGQPQLMPDYLTPEVSVKKVRADRAGDAPALLSLHLARFGQKVKVETLAFGDGEPQAMPLAVETLEFDARSRRLLVQTVSADHRVRRLLLYEGSASRPRLLHEEEDRAWIGPLARTAFFDAQGRGVAFTSERDDQARLFWLSFSGGGPVALTTGGVLVDHCQALPGGEILVRLARPDPARRALAVVDPETRQQHALAQPEGWNESAAVAAASSRIVFLHSRLLRPPELYASSLERIGEARQLTRSTPQSFLDQRLPRPELVRYQNPDDGAWVHAQLLLPRGEPPSGGWPAVIFLHGAGYLQNVTDSMTAYPADLLFHCRLAERGFAVLNPDYRGSRGYGRSFRTGVHRDLGGPDRRDVVAARAFLARRGVDTSRIGVYGGSYGGFLTLMCLFKEPTAFACGAALRPVTDWSRYHPGYVHPLLGSPKDAGGDAVYAKASPIHFADGLQRPLLLLHGMQDDNVFVQDTLRLIERLIELGKTFDAMLYPSQPHRFTKPQAWIDQYARIERLFERELR